MAADVSPVPVPRASPTSGMLRGRMEVTPDKTINVDMGRGDTWAKDVFTGKQGIMLDDIERLLQILGLKMVDASRICVTKRQIDEYEAYKTIARAHLAPPGPQLDWDAPA
jgi:hypothetical protein